MVKATKIWFAVTIHRSDGHEIDGAFYSDSYQTVSAFADSKYPLTVTVSRHGSEEQVKRFIDDLPSWFVDITPKT